MYLVACCLQDLFAPTYPSYPPVAGWQTGPSHGFGFNMQYNTPRVFSILIRIVYLPNNIDLSHHSLQMLVVLQPMQTFPQSFQSSNPFDLSNEASSAQAPTVRLILKKFQQCSEQLNSN